MPSEEYSEGFTYFLQAPISPSHSSVVTYSMEGSDVVFEFDFDDYWYTQAMMYNKYFKLLSHPQFNSNVFNHMEQNGWKAFTKWKLLGKMKAYLRTTTQRRKRAEELTSLKRENDYLRAQLNGARTEAETAWS